jgi:hypothetical protein
MSLDWCKKDDCMMSEPGMGDPEHTTIAGCNSTGGGPTPPPPGGGGGGYTPPPPSPGADPWKQYIDDLGGACPPCGERAPLPEETTAMQNLLPQVQCTDGKAALSQMLGDGTLMVYTDINQYYGVWNSNTGRIYISRRSIGTPTACSASRS